MSPKTTDTIPDTGINEDEVDMLIVDKNSHQRHKRGTKNRGTKREIISQYKYRQNQYRNQHPG